MVVSTVLAPTPDPPVERTGQASPPGPQESRAQAGLTLAADPPRVVISGRWTALDLGDMEQTVAAVAAGGAQASPTVVDASQLTALDSAGAWVLQNLLRRLYRQGADQGGDKGADKGAQPGAAQGLTPQHMRLLQRAADHIAAGPDAVAPGRADTWLQALGRRACAAGLQGLAMLAFLDEVAAAFAAVFWHPARWRWRQVLFNIRIAGFDALPIVGLLAFLLGIVVAYQSADQLRQFGANIFIVDVVGLSMLREFAPMMTAIIIAGRSGSAYAAQIGTMAVTEEIDAMRTLGISVLDQLVLPKIIALVVVLPLLTFFADVMGVLGGMLMAQTQLDIGYEEFIDRFTKAVSVTAFLVGIGKAPVFAVIIVVIGCFQGLQTRGGADSVGRQTTRAVVQASFMVIVADALFSIVFSALDL